VRAALGSDVPGDRRRRRADRSDAALIADLAAAADRPRSS
jgi:hypothetical protein